MKMEVNDGMKVGPNIVTVEVIRDGPRGPEVIQRRKSHNVVVLSGKKQIWRLVTGNQTNLFDQMRIRTSGAAATSNQTNVLSEVTGTLVTADSMTMASGRTQQWVVSYASGAGSKSAAGIEEVVILNQNTSPGGSCMMRATFTAVTKTTADKLKITYEARIT
jgi:hypothetical protein